MFLCRLGSYAYYVYGNTIQQARLVEIFRKPNSVLRNNQQSVFNSMFNGL